MKQFLNDLIHLTQGELFIRYFWIWVLATLIFVIVYALVYRRYNSQWQDGGFTTEYTPTGEEAPYPPRMDNLSSLYLVKMVERDHIYSVLELAVHLPYTVMDVINEANRLGYSFDNPMQDPNKVMIDKKV